MLEVRADKPDRPASLILDVELPDINGLDLQKQIAEGDHPPIVFITGHGDIPSSVRAIKHGAVDFLTKPFSDDDLMTAVQAGLAQDRRARVERAEMAALRERYATLTPRERDAFPLVISGLLNKQAAAELRISEVTFQIHRRNVMQKMAAASLADLVRMAERLQIPVTHSRRSGESGAVSERKRTIAVVDDDPRVLESLENLLESSGYVVRTFSSARALVDAGFSSIDCIITDIGMPIMDGFALHDAVKQARPSLPVFLITGRHEIGDQQRASSKDIRGFFRKPFDWPALLAAIGDALRT